MGELEEVIDLSGYSAVGVKCSRGTGYEWRFTLGDCALTSDPPPPTIKGRAWLRPIKSGKRFLARRRIND